MRSGFVLHTGSYGAVGTNENMWSRASEKWGSVLYDSGNDSLAYNLLYVFGSGSTMNTSRTNPRWFGFVLRCLSTAVEGEESGVI